MALSNIFNEPRREISEAVVGLLLFAGGLAAIGLPSYVIVCWLSPQYPHTSFAAELVLGGLISVVAGASLILLGRIVHFVGEFVCDELELRGVHLRPRERARNR